MRIGLDVMGGDFAPKVTIKGAIYALQDLSPTDKIVLFGPEDTILFELRNLGADPSAFEIVHAPNVILMGDKPIKSFTQKPDSSIAVGFKYMSHHQVDSFASAGNSGATLVGAIYSIGNVKGVFRPCTSALVPKESGGVNLILDVGTNPDVKPDVLYQFAILGSIYASSVLGIHSPRVGLLNIGQEEEKGNLLCQAAFAMMKEARDFDFLGNVEGRDLFKDKADVIVCDGFTGNIILKQMEAMYRLMVKRNLTDDYFDRFNYEIVGGSPVIGINGTVIIGHGISNEYAIKNMILMSKEVHDAKLPQKIKRVLSKYVQSN